MREFFKGWRRKVGCVALVMACTVAGMWMRSCVVSDTIMWIHGNRAHLIFGLPRGFCWMAFQTSSPSASWHHRAQSWSRSGSDDFRTHAETIQDDLEFYRHYKANVAMDFRELNVDFWSIVLPLTLLSAYLLLWKPRKRTEQGHA